MASEHKPDSKVVKTPVEYLCGNPNDREGEGTHNGEPGLPKRTETRFGVDELVRDEAGSLPKRKG